ncbi:MAG: right-handed parallel beta-helix repeat-containing protein [Candidatus Lokiarchaeota archaeon]|nr:right-handed parallel beta-helix repeat-containing protein [Candidatus Lokiarchaeota archaeon]
MLDKKSIFKSKQFLLVAFCLLAFFTISFPLFSNFDIASEKYLTTKQIPVVKNSYFNNSCGPILITENADWEDLADKPWCTEIDGVYYLENLSIDGDDYYCIMIGSTTVPFVIKNCTLFKTGSSSAIFIQDADNGLILENNISNCDYGIIIGISKNISIVRNEINTEKSGISILVNSHYNTISENTVVHSNPAEGTGIELNLNCTYNYIENNILYGGDIGNSLYNNCTNNTIYNNEIHNYEEAIWSDSECIYNNIVNNNIHNNRHGITLNNSCSYNIFTHNNIYNNTDYGVAILNEGIECTNNLFYYNRFNNSEGVNAVDNCSNNQWDNGAVGNYWHDYDGIDANKDGIGDTPYNISGTAGSVDRFPLVGTPAPPLFDIIFVIGVASVASVAVGSSLFFLSRRGKKKKKAPKSRSSKTRDREKLDKALEKEDGLEAASRLGDLNLTALSANFLDKVKSLGWDNGEMELFLKEMRSYSPETRQSILDEMLAFSKSSNKGGSNIKNNSRRGD